ncbi:kinase-like domain-containing protein [Butyriboletus roseoflavus]|nr:kinase-like domain-containing protein [Butyriboletus roseoflavus]
MNNITFPDFPPDLTQQIVRLGEHAIAGGAFADIWHCTYHHPFGSKPVAVKALRLFARESVGTHRQISLEIRRELEIWRRLDHPNVLPFLGITTGFSPFIALVSDWMPNGTLRQFLLQNDATMTIEFRLQLLVDISSGLEYLHSLPVIHGDLTPTNILIDENQNAYLSGFGLSTVPERIAERLPHLRADSDFRDGDAVSIRFMPPELLHEESSNIGTAMDIFSLGCNGLLVLSGQTPWSEFQRTAHIVLSLYDGKAPSRPSFKPMDDLHWEFLETCWLKSQDRPSASSAFLAFYSFLTSLAT